MRHQDFINELHARIDGLHDFICEHMDGRGDKEEDCQRLYVLNRLNAFRYAVHGIAKEDMNPEKEVAS